MGQPAQPAAGADVDFVAVQQSEQFRKLRRTHRNFVFPVAIAFLLWYFLYVLLADYAHDFMATKVVGSINIGLIFGLLQVVSTFAITTWYVSYANRRLDPEAAEIRERVDPDGTASAGPVPPASGASASTGGSSATTVEEVQP